MLEPDLICPIKQISSPLGNLPPHPVEVMIDFN
jgi:hypothetical protein